jgi:hypothetical protein
MAAASQPISVLLVEAQRRLSMTQTQLGEVLGGFTRKTVSQYQSGRGQPYFKGVHRLVRCVHPVDAGLAEKLAAAVGTTLEGLGLVAAPPPALPAAPAEANAAPSPPPAALQVGATPDERQTRLFVDAVLCAAAEALDVSPRAVRAVLFAAFHQAKDTGLSLETLAKALAPPKVIAKTGGGKKKNPKTQAPR